MVPESRDPHARRIDWAGAALSAAGLLALVWAVIEAPSEGWTSAPVLGAAAFAAAALAAFGVRQRRAAEPLLDLRLFRNPRFTAASVTVMVLFFALFGFLFLATQYLQFVLGYSPTAAGVRVLPYALAMIIFAPLSAKLVAWAGTRRVATAGMLLFAAGLAVAATIGEDGGYGRLAVAFVLMGAGMGLAGAPATESIMSALPPARANIGSAVNDTTRELGGALGVAVVGSIMASLYADGLPAGAPPAARDSLGAAVAVGLGDPASAAFVDAMSRASIVVAVIAALGAVAAWRYLPPGGVAERATADGGAADLAAPPSSASGGGRDRVGAHDDGAVRRDDLVAREAGVGGVLADRLGALGLVDAHGADLAALLVEDVGADPADARARRVADLGGAPCPPPRGPRAR